MTLTSKDYGLSKSYRIVSRRRLDIVRLVSVRGGPAVPTAGVAMRQPGSGGCGQSDDLVPSRESGVHLVPVPGCGESVPAGRKCGDIPLNVDRNRCAPPGELNFFIDRSRARVGW